MGEKMTALVPDSWYIEDKWIINDNKIRLYLDNMYEDEYKYVSLNRHKYDISVQNIIAEYDPPIKLARNIKLKIKDIFPFYRQFIICLLYCPFIRFINIMIF